MKPCKYGGWMEYAFSYIKDNEGIVTEDSYPYVDWNRTSSNSSKKCGYKSSNRVTTVAGFANVRENEEDLKSAVATQVLLDHHYPML